MKLMKSLISSTARTSSIYLTNHIHILTTESKYYPASYISKTLTKTPFHPYCTGTNNSFNNDNPLIRDIRLLVRGNRDNYRLASRELSALMKDIKLTQELVEAVVDNIGTDLQGALKFLLWAKTHTGRSSFHDYVLVPETVRILTKMRKYYEIFDVLNEFTHSELESTEPFWFLINEDNVNEVVVGLLKSFVQMKAVHPAKLYYALILQLCKDGHLALTLAAVQGMLRKCIPKPLDGLEQPLRSAWCNRIGQGGEIENIRHQTLRRKIRGEVHQGQLQNEWDKELEEICNKKKIKMEENIREVVEEMKKLGFRPDTATFNFILRALSVSMRIQYADVLVDYMRSFGCEPDCESYHWVLQAACEALTLKLVFKLLNKMVVDEGFTLRHQTVSGVIRCLQRSGNVDGAYELVTFLEENYCALAPLQYKWIAEFCICKGKYVYASNVLLKMCRRGHIPPIEIRQQVLMALYSDGEYEVAGKLKKTFMDLMS